MNVPLYKSTDGGPQNTADASTKTRVHVVPPPPKKKKKNSRAEIERDFPNLYWLSSTGSDEYTYSVYANVEVRLSLMRA